MDCYSAGVELSAGGHYTITLAGELDMTSREPLRALVDACLESGAEVLTFDMLEVQLCGSDCAALIAYAMRRAKVEVAPSPCVLRTLEVLGMTGPESRLELLG